MRSDKVNPRKRYPPAYYRYRQTHVTLSILLSNDLRDYLDRMRSEGMTYPEIVKDALEGGKRIHDSVEADYESKLNEQIEKCREESERSFNERLKEIRSEIREEIRNEVKGDVKAINGDLTPKLQLRDDVRDLIVDIFRDHGFDLNVHWPERPRNEPMICQDWRQNSE